MVPSFYLYVPPSGCEATCGLHKTLAFLYFNKVYILHSTVYLFACLLQMEVCKLAGCMQGKSIDVPENL